MGDDRHGGKRAEYELNQADPEAPATQEHSHNSIGPQNYNFRLTC